MTNYLNKNDEARGVPRGDVTREKALHRSEGDEQEEIFQQENILYFSSDTRRAGRSLVLSPAHAS